MRYSVHHIPIALVWFVIPPPCMHVVTCSCTWLKHSKPSFLSELLEMLSTPPLPLSSPPTSPPFTIQRLCELVLQPKKHYKKLDYFMRAVEKVSTQETHHPLTLAVGVCVYIYKVLPPSIVLVKCMLLQYCI